MRTNWWRDFKGAIATGLSLAGAIALVIAVYAWVNSAIDTAVERKLSDPAVLRQVAAQARPAIIFDARESVIVDLGGAQFIKDIKVETDPKYTFLAREIDVDFTVHLPVEPILTPLARDGVSILARRGKGFAWHYTLAYANILTADGPSESDAPRRYRLELIR